MRGWFATLNVVSGQRTADDDYLGFLQRSFRTMDAMRDDKKLARRPTTRHPACDDLLTDRASSSSPVCQCLTQPAGQRDVDTVDAVHACGAVRRRQHAVRFSSVVRPPARSPDWSTRRRITGTRRCARRQPVSHVSTPCTDCA